MGGASLTHPTAYAALSGHGLDLSASARTKVFWFFSSEKNILPHVEQGAAAG
jgi:hypothetical protein